MTKMISTVSVMNNGLKHHNETQFNEFTIATVANIKYVMFKNKYETYGREFGRLVSYKQLKKGLMGLGGKRKVLREVKI